MQLHVTSLSKRIGSKLILDDISFFHKGGVLGIAGPNGSGKSTLLKCLSGLMRPSSGSIEWQQNGKRKEASHIKPRLGYAAPYISHYAELTTRENLMFISNLRNLESAERKVDDLLEKTEIAHRAHVRFGSLSSGQQQRVRIASVLLHDPEILFLDEPGTNLDETGHHIIKDIVDQAREQKKLVLLASNSSSEINLCDDAIHLSAKE